MSNENRKTSGIIFLIVLIVVGAILKTKSNGAGWTLVILGVLGLIGIFVDWVHNKLTKPD